MSVAAVCAFAAAGCAVGTAWEATGLIAEARVVARLLALGEVLGAVGTRGRAPSSGERQRLGAIMALGLLAGGWLLAGPWWGAGAAAGGPWLLGRVVLRRRARWRAALAAGAAPVARGLADALAGGHSVRGALVEVAGRGRNGAAVDVELLGAAAALALGEPTEAVLERLRDRAGGTGWETIAAAVLLQREAGGDLAGLLRELAADIEALRRAEADARAATAQARLTAWIVCALPLAAAVLGEVASPGAAGAILGHPAGVALCVAAAVLQGAAVLAVRRLARGVDG